MVTLRLTTKISSNEHGYYSAFLDWIRSYLSDRRHPVSIDGVHSPSVKPTKGVHQGSIVARLFFSNFTTKVDDLIKCNGISYNQCTDNTQRYITIGRSDTNGFAELPASIQQNQSVANGTCYKTLDSISRLAPKFHIHLYRLSLNCKFLVSP